MVEDSSSVFLFWGCTNMITKNLCSRAARLEKKNKGDSKFKALIMAGLHGDSSPRPRKNNATRLKVI